VQKSKCGPAKINAVLVRGLTTMKWKRLRVCAGSRVIMRFIEFMRWMRTGTGRRDKVVAGGKKCSLRINARGHWCRFRMRKARRRESIVLGWPPGEIGLIAGDAAFCGHCSASG